MPSARIFAALLLAAGMARPAAADEAPLYLPARDVAVTYRLTSGEAGAPAGGREAHMYYSAALNKLRLDEPSQKNFVVIDRNIQQMYIVMAQMHAYTVAPFDPALASGFILSDKMKFTRTGSDKVAGLPCTRWDVTAERTAGTVCVTADGVLLSGRGRQHEGAVGGIDAVAVSYGPQPASLFAVPGDFAKIAGAGDAPAEMRLVAVLALAATICLIARSAVAQERPQTRPTRDVDITYRINRAGQVLEERTRWLVAQDMQRIDPPGNAIHMVVDLRTRHASMVDDTQHTVIDMAINPAPSPLDPGSSARFTRRGDDIVAGLACTNWETASGGPDTVLCITADGALLRVQTAGHTLVEAVTVAYGPGDPAVFAVPSGYRHVAPPKAK